MINIAIDGPAGSGKSTVAKIVSDRLDILYLDTGAMYRACGLKCKLLGLDCKKQIDAESFISSIDIKIKYENGNQVTLLDGKDVSFDIRKPDISMLASDISAHKAVRMKMVEMQRKIAESMDCVLDGRDIGTFVLPNAKYKFYLTAAAEVRAERRYKELICKGETVSFDKLKEEIIMRDYNDCHREFAPLKQAADAVYVDTSEMTIDKVVNLICETVKKGEKI